MAERIALYVASLRGGGAERIMVNLAQGFAARGLEVDLVLPQVEGPYLDDVPANVRVVDLKASRVLLSLPALVRYLRRERPTALISAVNHANVVALWAKHVGVIDCRNERPTALISAVNHANVVALWAKHLSGVPTRTVVTVHNTLSSSTQNAWNRRQKALPQMIGLFFPWADEIVAVSEGVATDLIETTGLSRRNIRVIYNPVITPELQQLAAEPVEHPWFAPGAPPVVLGVGRLAAQKDFPTLLRAFALVREQSPARLMILGEGRERPQLELLVKQLQLEAQVALPGFVRNPYAFLRCAHTFVLSSSWEGLPTVLIEALALGVPVVSTDCKSGPSEILEGGKYGRLVPVGDASALAAAVLANLKEPTPRADEKALERFTPMASLNAYLQTAGVKG